MKKVFEKDKISIVVPIYKVEKYLDKCVESLTQQTYRNLEIILVDDGSPDACPMICDDWAEKDNRVVVIHKKNGGLSDARNVGIEVATGEYITFVDSDDYLSIDFCALLFDTLKKNNADIAMSDVLLKYEDESLIKSTNITKNKEVCIPGIEAIYDKDIRYNMTAWAKVYKLELFEGVKYPIGRLHEDEFVFFKLFTKCNLFVINNNAKYYYLQRGTSIMYTKTEKNVRDILDAFEEKYNYLEMNVKQNHQLNLELYARELRSMYPSIRKYSQIKKEIREKYNEIYNELNNKSFKNWLFKFSKILYLLFWKIKIKLMQRLGK